EDRLALRKKMTEQLIIEESRHEALEEMYFWPAVRDRLESGDTLADEATGQEQDAKQVLASLDKLGPDDGEFEQLLGTFIMDARGRTRTRRPPRAGSSARDPSRPRPTRPATR